ncbi:MAG: hypothetical protein JO222_00845 [Frankiales bacterium]|nr:hypothetical protein [Frankiales bacterium]
MSPLPIVVNLDLGVATDYLIAVGNSIAPDFKNINGKSLKVWDSLVRNETDAMLVIGAGDSLPNPPGPSTVTRARETIGTPFFASVVIDVPCHIDIRSSKSMKDARDTAVAVFNDFSNVIDSDPGGAGAFVGGSALITDVTGTPSLVGGNAEGGFRYVLSFTTRVTEVKTT